MPQRKLITFDWAMKKLLRSKANFEILEGFLSELLKDDIRILEVLESESNKEHQRDKFNRVDLKVKNEQGEIIIIEVQYEREFDYLQRILFGTAKMITEHLEEGAPYSDITKVISVNILYFDLSQGSDYIYHGLTSFRGLHEHDLLQLSEDQQALYRKKQVHDIFPEYYLIRVNNFNDTAKDGCDYKCGFINYGMHESVFFCYFDFFEKETASNQDAVLSVRIILSRRRYLCPHCHRKIRNCSIN
ncbi:MAG: Rpn family recombination-promoting nuclease/putative transposase [Candidatus Electrothrix sp. YB6]